MVDTLFIFVTEEFPTPFVNTFLRHGYIRSLTSIVCECWFCWLVVEWDNNKSKPEIWQPLAGCSVLSHLSIVVNVWRVWDDRD